METIFKCIGTIIVAVNPELGYMVIWEQTTSCIQVVNQQPQMINYLLKAAKNLVGGKKNVQFKKSEQLVRPKWSCLKKIETI